MGGQDHMWDVGTKRGKSGPNAGQTREGRAKRGRSVAQGCSARGVEREGNDEKEGPDDRT